MERPYRITRAQWDALRDAKLLEPDVVYLIGEDTVMCARLSPGDVATLDPALVGVMAGQTSPPGPELDETDPTLLWLLRRMGDEWGPSGVLRTARKLWPDACG